MSLSLLALLLALFLVAEDAPVAPPPAAQPLDALLQSTAARLSTPEPTQYNQTETEEDLDSDNHVTSTRKTWSVQHKLPGGKEHGDVVQATEDGRDVTPAVREFRAKKERDQAKDGDDSPLPIDLEFHLPFEASQLSRYAFTRTGGTDAAPLVHFEPKSDRHRLWEGEAKLDAATGTILELNGHPAVLPMFVDQIDIRMEYRPEVPLGAMPSRVVIVGGAHFLFFHKRMRYTSLCSPRSGAAAALSSMQK